MKRWPKNLLLLLLLQSLAGFLARAQEPKAATPAAPVESKYTQNVDAAKFDQLRSGTNVVVLDVRTKAEYDGAHLPGAVLLDYRAADFTEKVAKLDKSKRYLVHCAAGGRSARACAKMETLGFTNLINLEGGLGAWEDAGKPVEK